MSAEEAQAAAAAPEIRGAGAGKLALRAAVTLGLLGVVLWRLDPASVLEAFTRVRAPWVVAALAAVYLAIALNVAKWALILRRGGVPAPVEALLRTFMIGQFFNNLLPTTVGGDVVRAYELGREIGDGPAAAASVVSDRLIAALALGVSALLGLALAERSAVLGGVVAAFLAVAATGALLIARTPLVERLAGSAFGGRGAHLAQRTARAAVAIRATLRDPVSLLGAGVLSVLFQAAVALVVMALFHALGAPVGLAHCVAYVPIVSVLTMLPVSIAGLGVQEIAFAFLFTRIGVPGPTAVAVSLMYFAVVAMASLPGAPLWLLSRRGAR